MTPQELYEGHMRVCDECKSDRMGHCDVGAKLLDDFQESLGFPVAAREFHQHLDTCAECANGPFKLCRKGRELLMKAGRALNIRRDQDESITADQAIEEHVADQLQTIFGLPVYVMKPPPHFDLNIFMFKFCIYCACEHSLIFTLTSHPAGYVMGLNGDGEGAEIMKKLMPPNLPAAQKYFDGALKLAREAGYTEGWRGRTLSEGQLRVAG